MSSQRDFSHPLDPFSKHFAVTAFYRDGNDKVAEVFTKMENKVSFAKKTSSELKFKDEQGLDPKRISTQILMCFPLEFDKALGDLKDDGTPWGDYTIGQKSLDMMIALLEEVGYSVTEDAE